MRFIYVDVRARAHAHTTNTNTQIYTPCLHIKHPQIPDIHKLRHTRHRYTGAHALLPDALFALSQGCSMISATILFTHAIIIFFFSFFSRIYVSSKLIINEDKS